MAFHVPKSLAVANFVSMGGGRAGRRACNGPNRRQRIRDIVGRDRLEQRGREVDRFARRRRMGDAAEELEELRRVACRIARRGAA